MWKAFTTPDRVQTTMIEASQAARSFTKIVAGGRDLLDATDVHPGLQDVGLLELPIGGVDIGRDRADHGRDRDNGRNGDAPAALSHRLIHRLAVSFGWDGRTVYVFGNRQGDFFKRMASNSSSEGESPSQASEERRRSAENIEKHDWPLDRIITWAGDKTNGCRYCVDAWPPRRFTDPILIKRNTELGAEAVSSLSKGVSCSRRRPIVSI